MSIIDTQFRLMFSTLNKISTELSALDVVLLEEFLSSKLALEVIQPRMSCFVSALGVGVLRKMLWFFSKILEFLNSFGFL